MSVTRLGFDAVTDNFVVEQVGVYPSRALTPERQGEHILLRTLAGHVEFRSPWSDLRKLDGSPFASVTDAYEWIADQAASGAIENVTDLLAAYILARA